MRSRTIILFVLIVLLIGVVALGIWLIGSRDRATTQPSTVSHADQTVDADPGRDLSRFSRSRGARRLSPTANRARPARPPRDLVVSGELASALELTSAEQEQINTLIVGIQTDRRQLFDELSGGEKTAEEVSLEMGRLRRQLEGEIRDLLGDERATALLDALRQADK